MSTTPETPEQFNHALAAEVRRQGHPELAEAIEKATPKYRLNFNGRVVRGRHEDIR